MKTGFFDEITLHVCGGRGGNGMVSFHREKFVSNGPPDGGNGGDGGSVILQADSNINTFQKYSGVKTYKGEDGKHGHKNNRVGAHGSDTLIKVPLGTIVYDIQRNELIADLNTEGEKVVVARGGKGGKGNASFVSSIRQAPKFAEIGDIGEERDIKLEMQLVADVGLIGFPSAGKSTLISHLSSAKPKIGDYPFTTLVPNLGVVFLSDFGIKSEDSFIIADMPGIIEGASKGKGLGDSFLKHISRTAGFVFLLDPFSYEGKSITKQYEILRDELNSYKSELLSKDYFIVINKIDALSDEDRSNYKNEFLDLFPEEEDRFLMISGVSGEGLKELILSLWSTTKNGRRNAEEQEKELNMIDYIPHLHVDEQSYEVKKLYDVESSEFQAKVYGKLISDESRPIRQLWKIEGIRIEQIARMSDLEQEGALHRIYDVLKKMKIHDDLRRAGAKSGDYIKIAWHFIEYHDLQ